MAWGQRIKRELGSKKVYYNKGYTYDRPINRSALDESHSVDDQPRTNSMSKKFSRIAMKTAGRNKRKERMSVNYNTQSQDNLFQPRSTWLAQSAVPNGNTVSSFPMPF